MQYVIESNPRPALAPRPKTEERLAMEALEVGQWFVIAEASRVNSARCAGRALSPKQFSICKLRDGSGWCAERTA